jgi:hypothetical protein
MTDFRALCEELNGLLEYISDISPHLCEDEINNLTNSARAALAEQPVVPTPIPVRPRWPEFSKCDPQERVWAWNPLLEHWKLSCIKPSVHTHWLPANALPLPSND